MDELHDHRSFADRRRASLRRARPDVTGRVDPGDTRLEQVFATGCGAGEDEAVVVARDLLIQPFGVGPRTQEEE